MTISNKENRKYWRNAGVLAKSAVCLGIVFIIVLIMAPFSLNITASMPRGLYYTYSCVPKKGDIVQFRPSEEIWNFALEGQYVQPRWRGLLKIVATTSGDEVCWCKGNIYINGKLTGLVEIKDSTGRKLGYKKECVMVAEKKFLPLAENDHSFDGRYFGMVELGRVQYCGRPVWVID